MIVVIDKKVVKHLVETGDGLLEIPVRVSFEYHVENNRFVDGTMKREILYNRGAVRKHFPRLDDEALECDISSTVDRSLAESLRYAGHARGAVALYPPESEEEDEPPRPTPQLILPGDA